MSAHAILQYAAAGVILGAFVFLALVFGWLAWLLHGDERWGEAAACAFGAGTYVALGLYLGWGMLP